MKVGEVMCTRLETVSPKTPFRKLWEAIFKKHIHALLVTDDEKKLLGIVTEGDLLKPLYPNYQDVVADFVSAADFDQMEERIHDLVNLTASNVMNKRVVYTRPDSPVMRALARMIVRTIRLLPVLSEEGVVVGVISKGDIFDDLFRRHLRLRGFKKQPKLSLFRHLVGRKKKK